jgi:hypothetical protein
MGDQPQRELVTDVPAASVDYLVTESISADHAQSLLQSLIRELKIGLLYKTVTFPLPGQREPNLIFIRGKPAEVKLIKLLVTAMEEAASQQAEETGAPDALCLSPRTLSPSQLKSELLSAGSRLGLHISAGDFIVCPGTLIYAGNPCHTALLKELGAALDRARAPWSRPMLRHYARDCLFETGKDTISLLSIIFSALVIILLHLLLSRIPVIGNRYRRSFHLFWENLFASFKGKDLAWEIIRTAADLGVAASMPDGIEKTTSTRGLRADRKRQSLDLAGDYLAWRGVDIKQKGVGRILETAVEAALAKENERKAATT